MTRLTRIALCACALASIHGCSGSSSSGNGEPPPAPPPIGGLDARPDNLTCLAPPLEAAGAADVALEQVFSALSFTQPLAMMQVPEDDSRWFVLEKPGRVRVFANAPDVSQLDVDFIELDVNTASEGGLLGMAFHPDFEINGEVFLSWTEGTPMVSVVARFTTSNGGLTLDPGSREDIILANQPFNNHNGGQIAFGPDGYLYIGLGDGGSSGDPDDHAQDTTDLLGAFLRLDVDGGTPYTIPADNPFADHPACPADHSGTQDCPEIYAWGLRNPWRWSFDGATDTLWVADVGQSAWEEINHITRGGNYGWNCREGANPYPGAGPSCAAAADLIDPVFDYPHPPGQRRSVTGGYVYRGTALPGLVGQYVFGDYVSGHIWRLIEDGAGGYTAEDLVQTSLDIASFAVDNDGELYVVDLGGSLHRLVAAGDTGGSEDDNGPPVATLLSQTGCVDADDPTQPAQGLIPYDVAAPAWFDGALRERWLAVPNGTAIAIDADDDFVFPDGTVLMERFRLQDTLIETRLLMRHPDSQWAGYSYEWDEQQSDARLVEGGKTVQIAGQEWRYPTGGQCLACHTAAAGVSLGLETAQLNWDYHYEETGRSANQLETLDAIALFETPLGDPGVLPAMPNPADASAPPDERARAYLHVNCAGCHRGTDGPTPGALDLRFGTLLEHTAACDVEPQEGGLGLTNPRIVAPGAPERSVLLARMDRRDALAMPPLGSRLVDAQGVALIADWIDGLAGCQQ
jgi:uncharacterized repeat protein (TIGR03806 family)